MADGSPVYATPLLEATRAGSFHGNRLDNNIDISSSEFECTGGSIEYSYFFLGNAAHRTSEFDAYDAPVVSL
jgi:hypothetical protein